MVNRIVISVNKTGARTLNITNSQNIPTQAGLQVMWQVPVSTLQTYFPWLNSNLSNLRFVYNGQFVPAWLESIDNGTATIWIKMPVSIPANSSIILNLYSNSALNFDGVYWGEAPQLSPTYAEYDNGASVFNNYDNFAGTTLNSKWINNGMSVSVNNGVTLTPSGSIGTWSKDSITYNTNVYNTNYIAETFTKVSTLGAADISPIMILNSNSGTDYSSSYTFVDDGIDLSYKTPNYYHDTQTSPGSVIRTSISMPSGYSYSAFNIYQIYVNGASVGVAINYSSILNTQTNYNPSTQYLGIGGNTPNSNFSAKWFRTRAYPPNGSMPAVLF